MVRLLRLALLQPLTSLFYTQARAACLPHRVHAQAAGVRAVAKGAEFRAFSPALSLPAEALPGSCR